MQTVLYQPMPAATRAPRRRARRNGPTAARNLSQRPMQSVGNALSSTVRQSYSGLDHYRVKHTEYIEDIFGSVNFDIRGLRINPAEPSTFPWLSRIAPNFEQYRFRSLKFHLKPQCGTTTPGSLIMAIDYDPSDDPPLDKAEILQYEGATRSAAWNQCSVNVPQKEMHREDEFYTAPSTSSIAAQKRQQDLGNLFVAVQGQLDDNVISELWVEYDLDLITPQQSGSTTLVASYLDNQTDLTSYTQDGLTNGEGLPLIELAPDGTEFVVLASQPVINVYTQTLYNIADYRSLASETYFAHPDVLHNDAVVPAASSAPLVDQDGTPVVQQIGTLKVSPIYDAQAGDVIRFEQGTGPDQPYEAFVAVFTGSPIVPPFVPLASTKKRVFGPKRSLRAGEPSQPPLEPRKCASGNATSLRPIRESTEPWHAMQEIGRPEPTFVRHPEEVTHPAGEDEDTGFTYPSTEQMQDLASSAPAPPTRADMDMVALRGAIMRSAARYDGELRQSQPATELTPSESSFVELGVPRPTRRI